MPQEKAKAYAWVSVSAANGDGWAISVKDKISSEMTPSAIEKGPQMAAEIWTRVGL